MYIYYVLIDEVLNYNLKTLIVKLKYIQIAAIMDLLI